MTRLSHIVLSAVCIAIAQPAWAAPQEFTPQAEADRPGIPWQALGLVLIKSSKRGRTYHSGFFVDTNVFVVASSPFSKTKTGGCEKETLIFTGQRTVAPDYDLKNVTPNHKCVKLLHEDRLRGYAIWQTESLQKDAMVTTIPLLTEEIVDKHSLDLESESLVFLGFNLAAGGARLKFSDRCRYKVVSGPFDEAGLDPLIWEHRWDWSSLDCEYESGMQGGPVLVRDRGDWFAPGLVVGNASASQDASSAVLATNFVRLTRFFGEKLEKRE